MSLPIIDVSALVNNNDGDTSSVASEIDAACREHGFFYVVGHGVSEELQHKMEVLSHELFALPVEEKMKMRMELGGKAWRGFFRVGDELTSGIPDIKEGIYFGTELSAEHPLVKAHTPLHGANLFPSSVPSLRAVVLDYLQALTQLGHAIMRGVALGLGLPASHFHDDCMDDPLILFRIFHYPPPPPNTESWGVGEHTDYGVLTILKQDDCGGLQVKTRNKGWIEAPPVPGSFVCNLGDMLEKVTQGVYKSTPHRVRNTSGRGRLSFPFFFDPNWTAHIRPIHVAGDASDDGADSTERWDKATPTQFEGQYSEYLLSKVSKVFPDLVSTVL